MKIRCAGLRAFSLPLVQPLATAHGPIGSREGWLFALMDDAGRVGFGEATPLPGFGTEEAACSREALERIAGGIVEGAFRSIDDALEHAARTLSGPEASRGTPCAMSALQSALCDLEAQRAGRSLAAWLRDRSGAPGEPLQRIRTQALVGGGDSDQVSAAARRARNEGFSVFKLKLAISKAHRDVGRDVERVAALRDAIGSSAGIRLDANEGWSRREAESALRRLEPFEIDYVEQPVDRADLSSLKALDLEGAIPMAADEALLGSGWRACLEARAARVFVLKPSVLGGPIASLELARRAGEEEIRIVWSNLIEGVVGRTVAIALAAATAPEEEVHGLGTADLLAGDYGEGARTLSGSLEVGRAAGLGCPLVPPWVDDAGNPSDPDRAGTTGNRMVRWGAARVFEARS